MVVVGWLGFIGWPVMLVGENAGADLVGSGLPGLWPVGCSGAIGRGFGLWEGIGMGWEDRGCMRR